jgi:DNA helicase II / ATP-dependent DNA helicase PcrA
MIRYYSFSSIDTYKQCPRRFFYTYILKLPRKPSIHFERGKILHTTVEKFFEAAEPNMSLDDMQFLVRNLMIACWNKQRSVLESLEVENLDFYFEESQVMAENWADYFYSEPQVEVDKGFTQSEAFDRLRPKLEEKYVSEDLKVIGFIDAITEVDGKVELLDFKTSKNDDVSKYKLQLGIYALLYQSKHGKLPDKAALFFFKHGKRSITVNPLLVEESKKEIMEVKAKTQSTSKEDYRKIVTPLCRWATGECDFFDKCFNSDEEYKMERYK